MVYTNHFKWHSRAQGIYHMQTMNSFRSPELTRGGRDRTYWLFAGLFNQDSRPFVKLRGSKNLSTKTR